VNAEIDARKKLFADTYLAHVPLIAHVKRVLDERPSHKASYNWFLVEIED